MKCKQCGCEVTADMAFCGECGCPVERTTASMRCPQCGNVVTAEDMFCGECGCKIGIYEEEKSIPIISEKIIADETNISTRERMKTVKSTLPSRKESVSDTVVYSEGKKFLKIADDFE